MKRYTVAMAFCMLSLICTAQEGWYIGVQANPFHYWMYNKQDFNKAKFELPYFLGADHMEPVSNSLFTPKGIGVGFSFGYSFYRNWGLSSGLGYSNQKQQFIKGNRYPELVFSDWESSITENLRYLHLPVSIEGNIPISHFVKLYGSIGLKYSMLIDAEFLYILDDVPRELHQSVTIKNKEFYHHLLFKTKRIEQHSKLAGNQYNTHLLGMQAGVGLQFRLGKYWSLHGAFTGSFDFINTERKKSIQLDEYGDLFIPLEDHDYYYSDFDTEPSTGFYISGIKFRRIPKFEHGEFVDFEPRANTHNIRAGFRIELLYYFNP